MPISVSRRTVIVLSLLKCDTRTKFAWGFIPTFFIAPVFLIQERHVTKWCRVVFVAESAYVSPASIWVKGIKTPIVERVQSGCSKPCSRLAAANTPGSFISRLDTR